MAGKAGAATAPGPAMRAWLAQIWRLSERRRHDNTSWVGTAELGETMEASPPVVSRMVTRLRRDEFLRHEPYRGVRLSAAGEHEALLELRRQRIAEVFLERVMGFGWHEVHGEAASLCSGLGDLLTERMAQMSGQPQRCPHGELIPAADGSLAPAQDQLLSHGRAEERAAAADARADARTRPTGVSCGAGAAAGHGAGGHPRGAFRWPAAVAHWQGVSHHRPQPGGINLRGARVLSGNPRVQ